MKCRLLLLLLILLPVVPLWATHLVGGDFELQHRQGNQYRLLLNLYFDEINGNPLARDNNVYAMIYEKGTNIEKMAVSMPLRTQAPLNYANPECATNLLRTSRIIYYEDIMLEPEKFNHPEGYYVVWERCCRNGVINNIVDPGAAGQTYYMEFPAVFRNGQVFRNSSPVLSPPISDYACINEEFSYDFGATDPDGDVVTFELVTPLNGNSTPANPILSPVPGPYAPISWLPGFSTSVQIMGNPALAIDPNTGRLTVTPTMKGLFVFSVRYNEFRNGEKIGEVRRDFQLLVNDCPRNEPPLIEARAEGSTTAYQEGQIIRIGPTDPRCVRLLLTDPDLDERLALSAVPVNFTKQGFLLAGQTHGSINRSGQQDTLKASLCFDNCFDTEGKTYFLDLIVTDFGDNGCGQPKRDTVRVGVVVEPTPDLPPALSFSVAQRIFEVYDGDIITFDVTGTDPDNDPVELSLRGQNASFNVIDQSMQFPKVRGDGQVTSTFRWQIDCKATASPVYMLEFVATSFVCGREVSVSELVEVRVLKRTLQNNTITANQVICYGDTPASLQGSQPQGGNLVYKYVWQVSTSGDKTGFTVTSGTERSYQPPALTQTSWYRRIAISGACFEIADTSQAVRIFVNPLPALPEVATAAVCPGFPASLTVTSTGPGLEFFWYDTPTGGTLLHKGPVYQTAPLTENTSYFVQVTDGNGCVSNGRTEVPVLVRPSSADAGPDKTIIRGRYAEIKGKGGVSYHWTPAVGMKSKSDISYIMVQPEQTTTYTLTVVSAAGCVYTDTMTVTVLDPIRPADAITLNGDNINDTWYIENIEQYPQSHIQVFTRWGAKVFDSVGYKEPWDGTENGKELPMAAYYYIIRLFENEKPITGSITLVK